MHRESWCEKDVSSHYQANAQTYIENEVMLFFPCMNIFQENGQISTVNSKISLIQFYSV